MKLGKKAPDFSLKDKNGTQYSLKSFKGNFVAIYFYPKDDTPGCTIQAKKFTADKAKLAKLKIDVVGISGGDEKSKAKFCKKQELDVLLLSDSDFAVAKEYKSFGEKTFMGRKYQGIFRNTFLLDQDRNIVKIFEKASPEDNSEEIMAVVKELSSPKSGTAKKTTVAKPKKSATRKSKKAEAAPKKNPSKKNPGVMAKGTSSRIRQARRAKAR